MWRSAPCLPLSPSEQAILEALAASTEIPTRIRKRTGIILSAAEGVPNNRIAHDLSTNQA